MHEEEVIDVVEVAEDRVQPGQLPEAGHHYVENHSRGLGIDAALELIVNKFPARVFLVLLSIAWCENMREKGGQIPRKGDDGPRAKFTRLTDTSSVPVHAIAL